MICGVQTVLTDSRGPTNRKNMKFNSEKLVKQWRLQYVQDEGKWPVMVHNLEDAGVEEKYSTRLFSID